MRNARKLLGSTFIALPLLAILAADATTRSFSDARLSSPLMGDADLLRLGPGERRVEQATAQIAARIGKKAAIGA